MSQGTETALEPTAAPARDERLGIALVCLSALCWSFGGTMARYVDHLDSWTVVFWRSAWAAVFLVAFMLWRDGWRGMLALFAGMGIPGVLVGVGFAIGSTCFIVALGYTTVANILLIQAGVPLPVVSRHLGHESIQVTVDVYGHIDRTSAQAAADAIAGMLSR